MQKITITSALILIAIIAMVIFGFTYLDNNSADSEAVIDDAISDEIMTQDFPTVSSGNPVITLKTSMGDISLELYVDRTPITAGNFIKLAESGFYSGTKFHRIINNFMIQGGDPNTKSDDVSTYGKGGPGYTIEDEFNPELSNLTGTISMANTGQPNSGGSQFFINLAPNTMLDFDKQPLTSKHPVFGHVIAGMDVVEAIAIVPTEGPERSSPVSPVVIEDVIITRAEAETSEEAPEE